MAELGQNTQGNITFITTFDGKLVQRVPEGTEGAASRPLTAGPNEGQPVWEKHYSNVTGAITAGEIAVKEFGKKKIHEIQIKLDDNILLQLPMNMLSMFAKPLPNVDIAKPVKISVYKNKAGRAGLQIAQFDESGRNEEPCEWAYTREEPNGLPRATQDDLGNLIKKVQEFFEGISEQKAQAAPVGVQEAAKDEPPLPPDDDIPADLDEENLPF